jgi:hypothetical protein
MESPARERMQHALLPGRLLSSDRHAGLCCRCHRSARKPPTVKLNRGTSLPVGLSNALEANFSLSYSIFVLLLVQQRCGLGGLARIMT